MILISFGVPTTGVEVCCGAGAKFSHRALKIVLCINVINVVIKPYKKSGAYSISGQLALPACFNLALLASIRRARVRNGVPACL